MSNTRPTATITYICNCAGAATMRHIPTIIPTSNLGCCWVECPDCGLQGDPAITEAEAVVFWDAAKRLKQRTRRSNG